MTSTHTAIGIDLGSSRFVIAVAKKGGVEILVNDTSYRQTPTVILFGAERKLGDKAIAHIKKELKNSIFQPTRLLGDVDSEVMRHEQPFNYCRIKLKEDGKAAFQVNYEGQQVQLTPEQAVGALFTEALDVLELNSIDNKEAVVSVPSYFTQVQRQAIIDSAKIAGVDVVKLYNESSATVMNYGIFRKADLSGDKPRTVAFVDVGHAKTSVAFANIWNDRAEIVLEESDANLGVRNIDLSLLFFYVKKFQEKYKVDLTENPKSMYRLMEGIEKQRKMLTANTEAVLNVEYLYEDIDFTYMLKREELEHIASGVFQNISELFNKCMADYKKLGCGALHSVERVGGGTRIPGVEALILAAFEVKQVSKTLDANESVARGCAIQAAILSPSFKVAAYNVTDRILYPITIKMQYENEAVKTKTLFDRGAEFNKTLSITVQKPSKLAVGLFVPSNSKAHPERQIVDALVEPMQSKEAKFEGKVCFLLNKNGMAQIERTELKEHFIVEEKIPVKKEANTTNKMDVEGEKKPEEPEFTVEKKERVRTTTIQHKVNLLYGISNEQLQSMIQFENSIIQKEKLTKETQKAKYLLESFIYNTRTKVSETSNARYTTAAERQDILSALQKAESWLYEEGANSDKGTYTNNLQALQDISKGYYSRSKKMEDVQLYYAEATPAFSEYEVKNAEMIAHGSSAHVNEIKQQIRESLGQLKGFENLMANYSISSVDAFDYEGLKGTLNKNYEKLNGILAAIKKEKEQKEKDAKKKLEDEEKKKKEQEAKAKQTPQTDAQKMDVEKPEDAGNKMEEEKP